MRLRGYRPADLGLLTGPWPAGELVGLPMPNWPPLAEHTSVAPPADETSELCVATGLGFVRFCELDWVHRRARLEIGLVTAAADSVQAVVHAALAHGFGVLNLRRVHGWVTPAAQPPTGVLTDAGFVQEAVLPEAVWLDGRTATREIWGVVRGD